LTRPVYKIETYTGANLDHTIEKEEISLYFKEVVTEGVGVFSFTVPAVKGSPDPYYYEDIVEGDKVKIWMDYDSVSGNPDFIGYVTRISGRMSTQEGFVRQISGLSQGEVLLRSLKKDTQWNAVGASTIVTALATDLGLGAGDIVADATAETIEVHTERYFDLLRRVSDYWANAGTQVKKDFYVDVDNDLVWKARPFRTVGVETLTQGDNIIRYNVVRDQNAVYNNIKVYGAAERPWSGSVSKDGWTEATTDWTTDGTLTANAVTVYMGTNSLRNEQNASADSVFSRTNLGSVDLSGTYKKDFNKMVLATRFDCAGAGTTFVRLWAQLETSGGNHFRKLYSFRENEDQWLVIEMCTGDDADWAETGSPDWTDINDVELAFDFSAAMGFQWFHFIDMFYFTGARYEGSASSGSADRDLEVIYENLHSDGDCDKRAETLLYQKASIPIQIEITTPGNPNILHDHSS